MPRDRHVARALELQKDLSLPTSLECEAGLCPILRPDKQMKIRLERHDDPPRCPECRECSLCAFLRRVEAENKPLEVDVGCGYGRFSRNHARLNPELRLLGIDQDKARIARTDVTARLYGTTNLAYVVGEARYALEYCIRPGSVSALYILFPDPWPKDRHAHNRIFQKKNIDLVYKVLQRGGFLHAATDNEVYFAQMVETMRDDVRFAPASPYVRSDEEKTDFELKFNAQGKSTLAASWVKR